MYSVRRATPKVLICTRTRGFSVLIAALRVMPLEGYLQVDNGRPGGG